MAVRKKKATVEERSRARARKAALLGIRKAIADSGFYAYTVVGGATPRWAYTIGLTETVGAEIILAGASFYGIDDGQQLIDELVQRLRHRTAFDSSVHVDECGTFRFRRAHPSWIEPMALGALDYYRDEREVAAYQIVPEQAYTTIDVPDMSKPWSAAAEPIWRWLREAWSYAISIESIGITNLDALRGARITEVARWEEDEWELFAGPAPETDAEKEDVRSVPLGTLLAHDDSLRPIVDLKVGEALRRDDDDGDWEPWG
jgi:hypothetical protein